MSEWQPIETAPRDGTVVLVWWPDFWVNDGELTDEIVGGQCCVSCNRFGEWQREVTYAAILDDDFEPAEEPTHWQPLPTPPEQAKEVAP